jgi:hypothetical protein
VSGGGQGRFAGNGSIGRYWQARCRGFDVRSPRGRRLGTVEALELDRETAALAVVLVRRRGRQRVLRVRPEWISLVDPWERCLVVRRPRRRLAPARPAAAARGSVRAARAGGAGAVQGTFRLWRLVPPIVRLVRAAGRRAALVLAFAGWVYSVVMFTAVRVVVRLALAASVRAARGTAWAVPRVRRTAGRARRHLLREWPRESHGRPRLRT